MILDSFSPSRLDTSKQMPEFPLNKNLHILAHTQSWVSICYMKFSSVYKCRGSRLAFVWRTSTKRPWKERESYVPWARIHLTMPQKSVFVCLGSPITFLRMTLSSGLLIERVPNRRMVSNTAFYTISLTLTIALLFHYFVSIIVTSTMFWFLLNSWRTLNYLVKKL